MRRLRRYGLAAFTTLALAAGILLLIPTGASSTPTRTLAALELRATFRDTLNEESCPPGAPVPAQVECFRFDGDGVVPGLGKATVTWQLIDDLTDGLSCQHFNFTTIVVKVAGKGEIDASLTDPKTHCWTRPPVVAGPFGGTVTGGSGTYAGASGNLQVTVNLTEESGGAGQAIETWVGTLTVPGLDFDLTPPYAARSSRHDRAGAEGEARACPLHRHGEGRRQPRGPRHMHAALGQPLQAGTNGGYVLRDRREWEHGDRNVRCHGQTLKKSRRRRIAGSRTRPRGQLEA